LGSEFYDEELEEIRRRKLAEYQRRLQEAAREEELRRIEEARRAELLRKILTPKARQRLINLRMAYPELARTVEDQIIRLAASGRVALPVTDDVLRRILASISQSRREIRIRFKPSLG